MIRGSYLLVITLNDRLNIEVGKLGEILFDRGYYIYTGSAWNGIEQRLRRHFREDKRIRWHIDYLTTLKKPEYAIIIQNKRIECKMASLLSKLFNSIRGFGSSDCKCYSHLFYSKKNPEKTIKRIIVSNLKIDSERLIYYSEKDSISSHSRW